MQVEVVDFDDGHCPALGRSDKGNTKLALNRSKHSTSFVSIFDDLLPAVWVERIYTYAVEHGRPWGVYVLTADLAELRGEEAVLSRAEEIWESDPERAFAMCATYALIMQRGRGLVGADLAHIHGTAVWCLCSGVTNSVEYHIDYAELHRYETNVIYPPLYAGTCHVSPISGPETMQGGDFCVNSGGIAHYRRFGYKAKLQDPQALQADMQSSPDWHTIRYKFNRGILHDGDLPHLSTPVHALPPGVRRVIMGFNCFTSEVGECCIRAPEHSQAFNRTVKLYQAMASATTTRGGSDHEEPGEADPEAQIDTREINKQRLSAKEILKNPALARLLVLAARKVKAAEQAALHQQG